MSERLKNKSQQLKDAVVAEQGSSNASTGLLKPLWLVLASGVSAGGAGALLFSLFVDKDNLDAGEFIPYITMGGIVAIILTIICIILHYWVAQFEREKQRRAKLQGQTQGVVVGMERVAAGGTPTGIMYSPSFSIEYDVGGQVFSTNWVLDFSTNSDKSLKKCEAKYIGNIIPVYYDQDNPVDSIASYNKDFSVSRLYFLISGFFGSSLVTFLVVGVCIFFFNNN